MIIILVGAMESGKSTYGKKYISRTPSDRSRLVYARVKRDFEDHPKLLYFNVFNDFLSCALGESNASMFVDEAVTCLPKELPSGMSKRGNRLTTWLVNSAKCNNFCFIAFHQLDQIPKWLIGYSEILVRWNTMENLAPMIRKFSFSLPVVKSLTENPVLKPYKPEIIKLR